MIKKNFRKPKRRLQIAHLHVWDKNNKGDVAIVLAVQELLRARFKDCQIQDFPLTILRPGGERNIKKTERDIKKINQANLIVIGGGGIFYSYFLPFDLAIIKAIIPPIVLFGVGYIKEVDAPNLSREAAASAVALVKKAMMVGVRDNNTKRFLIANGASTKKIEVIGDPAALLTERKPRSFKIADQRAGFRTWSPKVKNQKIESESIKIGLNLNYSGWLGFGKWREDILSAYREIAKYFQNEYGAQIYYLKHHPGENNIYPELKIKDLSVIDLKPAEQKYVYGRLDLVIGMMLHAGVLAFGAGTPEISVAYDLRNYSFAEFIGCPELVVDLNKLRSGQLLKTIQAVFAVRHKYRRLFIARKKAIFAATDKFLRNLKYSG